jgi:hypothetical protein
MLMPVEQYLVIEKTKTFAKPKCRLEVLPGGAFHEGAFTVLVTIIKKPGRANFKKKSFFNWRQQQAGARLARACQSLEIRLTTDFKSSQRHLTDLTKRDEPIFTGLATVKVMLHPVTSRDRMSSSQRHRLPR